MYPLLGAPKAQFLDSAGLGRKNVAGTSSKQQSEETSPPCKKRDTNCLKIYKLGEKRDRLFSPLILLPFSSGFNPKLCERPRPLHGSSEVENFLSRRGIKSSKFGKERDPQKPADSSTSETSLPTKQETSMLAYRGGYRAPGVCILGQSCLPEMLLCQGLNCVPSPKFLCSSLNPQDLRLTLLLEIGSLEGHLR